MMKRITGFCLILLVYWGCTFHKPSQTRGPHQTLLLISIDGFRWDYLDRAATPNIDRLFKGGVKAESLIPVFPTKTFPNHYSIVTGMYPESHGMVGNYFYDPIIGERFRMSSVEMNGESRWWGGEPIWVTVEKQGKIASTYFWPGSQAPIGGVRPTYWVPFKKHTPEDERVDTVLSWLDKPVDERPVFATLYFDVIDDIGHDHGPESGKIDEGLVYIDGVIGRLIEKLEKRGIFQETNIILVSDHGMTALSPDRQIFLEDYLDLDRIDHLELNPVTFIHPKPDYLEEAWQALQKTPHATAYRRETLPKRTRFHNHHRIPPLLLVIDEGWYVNSTREKARKHPLSAGTHGFDNVHKSMHGIFIAHGPAFKQGLVVESFENVHIYELMAAVLDLEPAANDGDIEKVRSLLQPGDNQ